MVFLSNKMNVSTIFYLCCMMDDRVMSCRALLVDMECGPLNETMRGPLGPLFSETQYVMDVYGAGMCIVYHTVCKFVVI